MDELQFRVPAAVSPGLEPQVAVTLVDARIHGRRRCRGAECTLAGGAGLRGGHGAACAMVDDGQLQSGATDTRR